MAAPQFNHDKMNIQWPQDLFTAPDMKKRSDWKQLIWEYMEHVRQLGTPIQQVEAREKKSAERFLELVNNDVAFAVAKSFIPDFETPEPDPDKKPQSLYEDILRALAPRLPQKSPVSETEDAVMQITTGLCSLLDIYQPPSPRSERLILEVNSLTRAFKNQICGHGSWHDLSTAVRTFALDHRTFNQPSSDRSREAQHFLDWLSEIHRERQGADNKEEDVEGKSDDGEGKGGPEENKRKQREEEPVEIEEDTPSVKETKRMQQELEDIDWTQPDL